MKIFFEGHTKKRSSWSLWEKNCRQKLHKKLFWQVWGNSGKNPSHPQKLPAATPMMKRHLRPVSPLGRSEKEMPPSCHHSPASCAYYSTRTLFTRCCRLQCITVMNIHYQRSPKTEQFITAKISGNALKQVSRTDSLLRQRSSQQKK